MSKRVCVVTGVGPGTGSALARRFAAGGYRVALLARTESRLRELAAELPGASAYPCDVADEAQIVETLARVAGELGPASVLVHNAVGGAFGDFQQIEPAVLERNFAVNVMALLHLARAVAPAMIEAGEGAILVTGNDVPWARRHFRDAPDDFFARPSAIAEVAFGLVHQDRSAWAFDVVVRPFSEPW
ncbi:MAG: SDR family NAD(P)-dependent oxidoreductase [Myxococcota bacterium]|nr:SDR family NAD(P)-dependent oxidoreductase [Myxococcota bacterium]